MKGRLVGQCWIAIYCLSVSLYACTGKLISDGGDGSVVSDGSGWSENCLSYSIELPKDENCSCECLDCNCQNIRCICDDQCYHEDCLITVDVQGNTHTDDPFLKTCNLDCVGGNTDDNPKMFCTVTDCGALQPCSCQELRVNSSGLKKDLGGLTLEVDPDNRTKTYSFIWIANSAEGTVSKIDTTTGQELARYRTGPGNPDPSRTTVGMDGDVVVANRGGSSVVRIHADSKTCPDGNGNGAIETSSGPQDILAWGQDECILWFHQFPQGSLARAAAFEYVEDFDGVSSRVWIGLYSLQKMIRMDARTGEVLAEVPVDGNPYGAALDSKGNLWIATPPGVNMIDTNAAVLQAKKIAQPPCLYGITVDSKGRVWTSGGNCVARYDPLEAKWVSVKTQGSLSNRGLAYDGKDSIWAADTTFGVHQVDVESMAVVNDIQLKGNNGDVAIVGMAVDFYGQIWAVDKANSQAHRIDPTTLIPQAFSTGKGPYTYSDMTGYQLFNVAPPDGKYNVVVESCGYNNQWLKLIWSADTPEWTSVRFAARTAETEEELASRAFVALASQPSDQSPLDIQALLDGSGGSMAKYLEIEITLKSINAESLPVLKSVLVDSSRCEQQVSFTLNLP